MAKFEHTIDPEMLVQDDTSVPQQGSSIHGRNMYIPPYELLLRNLGIEQGRLDDEQTVEIPVKLLKMLVQFALIGQDFDEDAYLYFNRDVAEAVQAFNFHNGFAHYLECGYFEGRHNRQEIVDEDWYLLNYPDAAEEIRNREFNTASDHFYHKGAKDGKAPNKMCLDDVEIWRYYTTIKK